MNKKTKIVISVCLLFSALATTTALARVSALTPTGTSTVTADATTVAPTTEKPSTITSRIEAYKKTYQQTISEAAKTRIKDRCVAAQAKVKTKVDNNATVTANRVKAYNEITSNLHTLSSTLAAKGVDVNTLNADLQVLQTKITAYTIVNATYAQAIGDVAALDCKTDPASFKVALEAARADQATLFKSATDIRTYITGTIQPVLKALKTTAGSSTK